MMGLGGGRRSNDGRIVNFAGEVNIGGKLPSKRRPTWFAFINWCMMDVLPAYHTTRFLSRL